MIELNGLGYKNLDLFLFSFIALIESISSVLGRTFYYISVQISFLKVEILRRAPSNQYGILMKLTVIQKCKIVSFKEILIAF